MHTYKVNTGLELSLERELADMTKERNDRAKRIVELRQEVRELQAQVKALCNQDEAQDEVARLKSEVDELEHAYNNMKQYADKLLDENVDVGERNEELKTNMALMTDESEELNTQLEHMSKAYNEEYHETQVYKKAWREQRELVALRDDQIAMLERRLAKHAGEKTYPFKEGDLYYVFNQLDGTWIESVWDDESERIHDSPHIPSRPHRVYFTVDQKNVLDKFKPEA